MRKLFWTVLVVLLSSMRSQFTRAWSQAAASRPADPDAPSAESQAEGHEVSDASAKTVGLFVLGLFAVIFTAMAALGTMYRHLYVDDTAVPVPPAQESFKYAPRDETSIAKDWDEIDTRARKHLGTYGWTDRANGAARIPIELAMSLVVSEGLPARTGQTPNFPPPDQEKLPLMELESTTDATKFDPHQ